MSDRDDRTLPPTQKRLDDARAEGQIPRSRELATAAGLIAGAGLLTASGGAIASRFAAIVERGLTFDHAALGRDTVLGERLRGLSTDGLLAAAPMLGVLMLAGLAGTLAVGGWNVTTRAFTPDFTRMSPLRGLGQIVSGHGAGELGKAVLKALLVGGVAIALVIDVQPRAVQWLAQSNAAALADAAALATTDFLMLAATMVLVAAVDVPFQLWRHHSQLRMSPDEVRREMREQEGDPQLKSRIRSQQREIARRRMMAQVPKADVVVVNPTHYAVALAYDESMRAPRVVAKGVEIVAARIRELATEHRVPIVDAPPLARALYRHAEIGDEVPAPLYTAVAHVLAYVFRLRAWRPGAGPMPVAPADVEIPPDMQVNA